MKGLVLMAGLMLGSAGLVQAQAPHAMVSPAKSMDASLSAFETEMMGLAKASLESQVRYLAAALGDANGISAGPIRTVAAQGIETIDDLLDQARRDAPMGRNVDIDEVGNAAAFLLSTLACGINGQIVHVDAGASIR